MDYTEVNYPLGREWLRSQELWCGKYNINNLSNLSWFIILIIGLILISFLIYKKHKGEKGILKKILKCNLIFFLIMLALGFIGILILWVIGPGPELCPFYLYEGV